MHCLTVFITALCFIFLMRALHLFTRCHAKCGAVSFSTKRRLLVPKYMFQFCLVKCILTPFRNALHFFFHCFFLMCWRFMGVWTCKMLHDPVRKGCGSAIFLLWRHKLVLTSYYKGISISCQLKGNSWSTIFIYKCAELLADSSIAKLERGY